ncbi:MAG: hypothetical protein M1546_02395 [Chloroflexi bacterium]|nr:hypothetical protein [Chloroflexota bacterium]
MDDTAWVEARLRTPLLSVLTWVQWQYDWPATPGEHVVRVRAYDGQGVLQITESHPEHLDGATGVFSWVFKV